MLSLSKGTSYLRRLYVISTLCGALANVILRPARPCQRCTKRGIASSCTEGFRKKAKYLLDEEELGKVQWLGMT
jgi:hypothetical protein